MELIALTKLMTNLSLYFSVTGFIMRFVGSTAYNEGLVATQSQGAMVQFFILIAIGMCAYFLRNKGKFRLLTILLVPTVFLLSRNIIDSIWVAFPCLIVITSIISNKYGCDRKRFIDGFKWAVSIGAICVFLYLFIPYTDGGSGENGTPLFFLLYVLSSVLLMRCMRQSDDVLNSRSFKMTNICTIAGFSLLIIALTYLVRNIDLTIDEQSVINAINEVGRWVRAVVGNIGNFFNIQINAILGYDAPKLIWTNEGWSEGDEALGGSGFSVVSGISPGMIAFLIALAVTALVVVLIILLRNKSKRTNVYTYGSDEDQEPETVHRSIESNVTPSNRNAVRKYYRKFLQICKKHNVSIEKHDTSLDIRNAAADKFDAQTLDALRRIYATSRYDYATPVDDSAVYAAKKMYASIKRKG